MCNSNINIELVFPVPCESLDSRDFFWNFTSRSRFRVIFISLSLLDLDFQSFSFHFHFSKRVKGTKISPFFSRKKEWNFTPSFMKNLTILLSRVKNPKQIMSRIMNGDTQLFIQDTTTNNSRFRFLLPILKVLHKKLNAFGACVPWVSQTNIKSFRAQENRTNPRKSLLYCQRNQESIVTPLLITVLVLEIFIVFLTLRCANFAALIHLHSNQVEDICLLLLLADLANS